MISNALLGSAIFPTVSIICSATLATAMVQSLTIMAPCMLTRPQSMRASTVWADTRNEDNRQGNTKNFAFLILFEICPSLHRRLKNACGEPACMCTNIGEIKKWA
ncbi:Uncharacterised protein [Serratia fonticola]|uniref:Uncharacterized protein n=1 Tax=Serratia fonticola TaxID=47917 RepID=A0A0F7H7G1_SERFO|nr:hypothetical protein WN53_03835 [Serratia fonticola]CAI1533278.1 Uncharacterised protein [Serratia fonticola]VTR51824.1 Uncharacterised protein [Serratia fonticola]